MSTSNVELTQLAYRLGWTLVHSLWQGAAVAMMLGSALTVMRRRSAQARYLASLGALALVVAAAAVTFAIVGSTFEAGSAGVATSPALTAALGLSRPLAARTGPAKPIVVTPPGTNPPLGQETRTAAMSIPDRHPLLAQATSRLEPMLPWFTFAWAVGVLAMSVWHAGGWVAAQRLRILGVRPPDDHVIALAGRVADRLGLRAPVRVLVSMLAHTPMVIGWLRPVVLLPAAIATGLTPAQLEGILAHELAHIRRHDYLVNLLQVLAETLLFYHPAVWWISRRVRLEREQCCDEIAVQACGDRWAYAESLTALEEVRLGAAMAVAAAGSGRGELLSRIRRVLRIDEGDGPAHATTGIAAVVLAALLAIPLPVALLLGAPAAGSPDAHRAADAAPATRPSPAPRLQFRVEARPDEGGGETDELKEPASGKSYRFRKNAVLTEADVKAAHRERMPNGELAVDVEFTDAGAAKLLAVTSDNLNRRMAILFEGRVLSMPVIRAAISRAAVITGGFNGMTPQEANALVDAIGSAHPPAAPATGPTTAPATREGAAFTADCVLSGIVDGKRKVLATPTLNMESGSTIRFVYTGKPPVVIERQPGQEAGIAAEVRTDEQPGGKVRVFCALQQREAANTDLMKAYGDVATLLSVHQQNLTDLERRLKESKQLLYDARRDLDRRRIGLSGFRPYSLEEICRVDPTLLAKVNARNEQQTSYDFFVARYGRNYPLTKDALQLLQIRQDDIERSVKRFNDEFFIQERSDGGPARPIAKDLSKLQAVVDNLQKQYDDKLAAVKYLARSRDVETDQIVKLGEPVAIELADGTRLEVAIRTTTNP